jgi:hypothetical protein
MKINPVKAELLFADRETDRHDEVNNRLLQFCERAKQLLLDMSFVLERVFGQK